MKDIHESRRPEFAEKITQRPLQIADVAQPVPGSGQVLSKVRACGVCRTDLHIVEGELPQRRPELIPGHQVVGEIAGSETPELPLGTRVGVSWIGGIDGNCWYCKHDLENLLRFADFHRLLGRWRLWRICGGSN